MIFNIFSHLPKFFQGTLRHFLGLVVFVSLLASCSLTRKAPSSDYFMNISKDTTLQALIAQSEESKIKAGDLLGIKVSSLNKEEDEIFNLLNISYSNSTQGYLVENDGSIHFHRVGNLFVKEMTLKQLSDTLETLLTPYLKDPVVSATFVNNRVLVFGEVKSPQIVILPPDNKISLMEALTKAGGLSEVGNQSEIMVIKDQNGVKDFKKVNLEDVSVFTSPSYYLGPNDMVYIKPDQRKISQQNKAAKQQRSIALLMSGITLFIVIYDRFLK